jgi:hypothetical protein
VLHEVSWLDDQEIGVRFLFDVASRLVLWPTIPPIQWILEALPPGIKWLGHEDDHSPPFSAEIKNARSYTFPPLCIFIAINILNWTIGITS